MSTGFVAWFDFCTHLPMNGASKTQTVIFHNWYDLSVASVEVEKIVVDYTGVGTQVTAGPASFTTLHGCQAGTDIG